MITHDQLKTLQPMTEQARPLFSHHKFEEFQNVMVDGNSGELFISRKIIEWSMGMPVIGYLVLDAANPEKPAVFHYEPRLSEVADDDS